MAGANKKILHFSEKQKNKMPKSNRLPLPINLECRQANINDLLNSTD